MGRVVTDTRTVLVCSTWIEKLKMASRRWIWDGELTESVCPVGASARISAVYGEDNLRQKAKQLKKYDTVQLSGTMNLVRLMKLPGEVSNQATIWLRDWELQAKNFP